MKYQKILCAALSMLMVYFYSIGMIPKIPNKKEKISLIAIIKTQQNILGEHMQYIPLAELRNPGFFKILSNNINQFDPKDENDKRSRKVYEKLFATEAITCINAIIYHHQLISDRLQLIDERFHTQSVHFLRKTINHNEEILKQYHLFDYYQHVTKEEKPILVKEKPIVPKEIEILEPIIQQQEQPQVEQPVINQPQQEEPIMQEPQPQQPQERKTGWREKIWQSVSYFFGKIYDAYLAIRTALFGEPEITKSAEAIKRANILQAKAIQEEQEYNARQQKK